MLLLDLPEEILFVILESAILPLDPRLPLSEPQSLLTCRTIHRIGLPILYQSILLRSNSQALKVKNAILSQPKLVCHIRHLYSSALVAWLPILRAIGDAKGSLQTFDFVFHVSRGGSQPLLNEQEGVWVTLSAVPVRHLVVRPGPGFYRGPSIAAPALARAIKSWTSLVRCTNFVSLDDHTKKRLQEVVDVEPRVLFLPLPHNKPSPLALELSRSPSLRVLRTPLPPAWNPSLLIVSENPSLVRIVFTAPLVSRSQSGVLVATDEAMSVPALFARRDEHPWFVEAQKHPRLMRLIGVEEGTDNM